MNVKEADKQVSVKEYSEEDVSVNETEGEKMSRSDIQEIKKQWRRTTEVVGCHKFLQDVQVKECEEVEEAK